MTKWQYLLPAYAVGCFVFESRRTGTYSISGRVERFSKGLNRLLLFIPFLAAAVFAVLFLFVLKGRFYERLCHAMLVLALWLYSARFYWFLISFSGHWRKTRGKLFCMDFCLCLTGMIAAAYSAIFLTPLDRYAGTIHSDLGTAAILPGTLLLLVFYIAAFFTARANRKKKLSES